VCKGRGSRREKSKQEASSDPIREIERKLAFVHVATGAHGQRISRPRCVGLDIDAKRGEERTTALQVHLVQPS
jgi:hypothetical protein